MEQSSHSRRFDPREAPQETALAMTVEQFAREYGERIVQAGLTAKDSEGRKIYSKRKDVWVPATIYDPLLVKHVRVNVRVRVTVEIAE